MNPERVQMLLDNYAAHFPEAGVPERLLTLWQAAERCAAAFDLTADDFAGMLRAAFEPATSTINYAGSVQPLNGLFFLGEKEPEALRRALGDLLEEDNGDLTLRQMRMQTFCESCGALLRQHEGVRRGWEINLRAAMALMTFLRPAENYLYKSTEARYLADMLGCQTDVASGPHFTLESYYAMCDELLEAIDGHAALASRLPAEHALPEEVLQRLMLGDILLNAGEKKLGLLAGQEPLILSRSRAGQAAQERSRQIARIQLDVDREQARLHAVQAELDALPEVGLIGQRFISRAFGEVTAVRVQGSVLYVETAEGTQRRLSQPACFLQGYLEPADPVLAERFARESSLLERKAVISGLLVDLRYQISRLEQKT